MKRKMLNLNNSLGSTRFGKKYEGSTQMPKVWATLRKVYIKDPAK